MLLPSCCTAKVLVLLAPEHLQRDLILNRANLGEFVRFNLRDYTTVGSFLTDAADACQAADEVFDMTNNPNRQEEREYLYGRLRSFSVGDVVIYMEQGFEQVMLVCAPCGWIKL